MALNDKNVVEYLEKLWNDDVNILLPINNITENNLITEINNIDIENFKEKIDNTFKSIKILSNSQYCGNERRTGLKKNELKQSDILLCLHAFKQLENNSIINNDVLDKINKVMIFVKHKSKDILMPCNYRYIQNHSKPLKLLDKFWCLSLVDHIKKLDTNIFICNIVRDMTHDIIYYADKNTKSMENIILLDLERAFDNVSYDVLEKLLLNNISRKNNIEIATKMVSQYMFIIKNRQLYYNNNIVKYKKGLPTGLTSSNIVYTMLMDEIIHEWLQNNDIIIDTDIILNIFVDDFYIKILNVNKLNMVVTSLVSVLEKYKFKVNFSKCKIDMKLLENKCDILNQFSILTENDLYLGIPFTRDYKKYTDLILKKYNERYNCSMTYDDVYINELFKKIRYYTYKMKPIILVGNK